MKLYAEIPLGRPDQYMAPNSEYIGGPIYVYECPLPQQMGMSTPNFHPLKLCYAEGPQIGNPVKNQQK